MRRQRHSARSAAKTLTAARNPPSRDEPTAPRQSPPIARSKRKPRSYVERLRLRAQSWGRPRGRRQSEPRRATGAQRPRTREWTRRQPKHRARGRRHAKVGDRIIAEIEQTQTPSGAVTDTKYPHQDLLGSTVITTRGGTITRAFYEPFGALVGEDGRTPGTGPGIKNDFTGHERDGELINMRGRMYDPALRRFTTPDPLLTRAIVSQGHNAYSYVLNSPLRFADPSGYAGEGRPGITNEIDTVRVYQDWDGNPLPPPPPPPEPPKQPSMNDFAPLSESGALQAEAAGSGLQALTGSRDVHDSAHLQGFFQLQVGGSPETKGPMLQRELYTDEMVALTEVTVVAGAVVVAPEAALGGMVSSAAGAIATNKSPAETAAAISVGAVTGAVAPFKVLQEFNVPRALVSGGNTAVSNLAGQTVSSASSGAPVSYPVAFATGLARAAVTITTNGVVPRGALEVMIYNSWSGMVTGAASAIIRGLGLQ